MSTGFNSSDVAVVSSRMRQILTAHGTVAFVYNAVLIALLVSLLITVTA